jgi:hypothetical protein
VACGSCSAAALFRFQQSIGSTLEPTPGDASPLFRTIAH